MNPPQSTGRQARRDFFFLILLVVGVIALLGVGGVLSLVLIAVLLSYILEPVVTSLEVRGFSRTAAALTVFLVQVVIVFSLAVWLVPVLIDQVVALQSPEATEQTTLILSRVDVAIHEQFGFLGLEDFSLPEAVAGLKQTLGDRILDFLVKDAAKLIIELVTIPFMMFFFMKDGREMKKYLISAVPNRYFEFSLDLLHKMDAQLGVFLRSQFLDGMVFGALSTIALWILDVPYFLFIGPFAGFANLIPYVGPIAGVVPAVILSILQTGDFSKALTVIIVYVLLKLIDDILIQPMVVARGVDQHPVLVLVAILVAGHLFGILGMLLAVPVTGFFRVVLGESMATFRKYRFT